MPSTNPAPTEGQKDAVKTYVEQTKLLVTLSSAFLIAPATFAALFDKDRLANGFKGSVLNLFLASEALFIASVLCGYVVLASIAGFQHLGIYDVYRRATRWFSIAQIGAYLMGLGLFGWLALDLANMPKLN